MKHEELTQAYSTWGDKLLQHADVLNNIQNEARFAPITIQLAPCEPCDSHCPFCSVAGRPMKSQLPFDKIRKLLYDFRLLGAKSIEITGGGNPMLYRDKASGATINNIVYEAAGLGYKVGIITNSHNLSSLASDIHPLISWVRVSLIQLDEGINPEEYNFAGFPADRLALSYIIYGDDAKDPFYRGKHVYTGTSPDTIRKIARLIELWPEIKFVRIAGNCLIKGNNLSVRNAYRSIIDEVDKYGKFFIKDIGENDSPYEYGCYVGAVRPYIAPHPDGGNYQVYVCTSHVLNTRTYDLDYSLGSVEDVLKIWDDMNARFASTGYPYEIKSNRGRGWQETCKFCYYYNNNKLLHTVANELPDKDFA